MNEVTARLENWTFMGNAYYGQIYNDVKGRFPDGTFIHTSHVITVLDGVVYTLNSSYELGKSAR